MHQIYTSDPTPVRFIYQQGKSVNPLLYRRLPSSCLFYAAVPDEIESWPPNRE